MNANNDRGEGGVILAFIIFALLSFGITFAARQHGISSCEARGGTPIVRSWISDNAWDVSCIREPRR